MLKGKKILIGITGSIAAYKIPLLVRLFIREGAEVKVVMTRCATDFVTPLTLSTLSQKPVLIEPYDKTDGSWHSHVDWGRWADVFVLAPVSANTLAKMAAGIADNLLTTTYLAAKCPVFFAPAMDLDMYHHPTTQRNTDTLLSYGNHLIAPNEGELASGLVGAGRMEEPEVIFRTIADFLEKKNDLNGRNVLVSAGPTFEPIDPVRFIGNHSSGKMGYAIALQLAERGAAVTLVSGPVSLKLNHHGINLIKVNTAEQMAAACLEAFPACDAAIMSAAVADFTPVKAEKQKIKKTGGELVIQLKPTTDILAAMGKLKMGNQLLVGFALETENEFAHASAKLKNKNLDLIVLNSLNDEGAGFGTDTNKVTLISAAGEPEQTPLLSKREIAAVVVDKVAGMLNNNN
ncbi:MAG: bifunctional phosphopantothenoylcysteine decarboxylase/phosphopantothenate--cysteine ligase CoaBC [Bacteroidales bacterium]|jgi:phosphopantothenoylcysteine decarboxylase/phosphopantothenate--cysteine ligase|nr:bifunctional phosphopantothenoylcysteine decarboxylase/phosphopantothenate--cysteine ligase CoaBC [Bacteroidales bacterium]